MLFAHYLKIYAWALDRPSKKLFWLLTFISVVGRYRVISVSGVRWVVSL